MPNRAGSTHSVVLDSRGTTSTRIAECLNPTLFLLRADGLLPPPRRLQHERLDRPLPGSLASRLLVTSRGGLVVLDPATALPGTSSDRAEGLQVPSAYLEPSRSRSSVRSPEAHRTGRSAIMPGMRPLLTRTAVLLVAVFAAALGQPQEDPTHAEPAKTALILIDIQNFYFASGKLPLDRPVEASLQAKKLLDRFRVKGWPVIHVQHLPADQTVPAPTSGDEPYRIQENVRPLPDETVIGKHEANSFHGTELEALLRRLGVARVVIAGMQTHMCVEAATRAAADLGFEVVVVHDACATRALRFGGTEVPAAHVHAAALAAMNGSYARVVSTDELLAELE